VANTRAEYERLVSTSGENSRAAQDMQIKLNKETETLNKMNAELAQTNKDLVEVKKDSDQAGNSVGGMAAEEATAATITETLDAAMAALKVSLTVIIAVLALVAAGLLGMAGAGIEAGKAISNLVNVSAEAADKLAELSAQTGISTDKLQEMNYAGKLLGTGVEVFTSSQAKMIRSMQAARDGTGSQAEAFKQLGIRVTDAKGQLRDSEVVFGEVLDKLRLIQNPTERDAQAMAIFGKSAQELNPLINAGSAGLAEYAKQAHEMGAVVDSDTIQALSGFKDQLDSLDLGLKGVGSTIAGAFLPYFGMIGSAAQRSLADLSKELNGARGLDGMVKAFSRWFVKAADEFAREAPGVVKNIADTINKNMPILIPALTQGLVTITGALAQMAPIFVNMAIVIITALGNALAENATTLEPAITQMLIAIGDLLIQSLPSLIPAMMLAAGAIIGMLVVALAKAISRLEGQGQEAALKFIGGVVSGAIGAVQQIIGMGKSLLDGLYNGFVKSLPKLSSIGPMISGFLSGAIQGAISGMVEAGARLVQGLWQGIQGSWGQLVSNFQEYVDDLVQSLKDALGIASPSKVGISIGKNFGGSIGLGMMPALEEVRRSLVAAMTGFQVQPLAGAEAGVSQSIRNDNFGFDNYGTVIFQGAQTPGTLAASIKGKRY
jgi:hypothetical protein